jgi:hypothetical protein
VYSTSRFNAIHNRHLKIEDHEVWLHVLRLPKRLQPILRLDAVRDALQAGYESTGCFPDSLIIVCDEHGLRHRPVIRLMTLGLLAMSLTVTHGNAKTKTLGAPTPRVHMNLGLQ